MSDLPSRDAVAEALTFAPLTDVAADPIYDIARAYVHGGRLVDREAIVRGLDREFPGLDMSYPVKGLSLSAMLDAAIGGSDEK